LRTAAGILGTLSVYLCGLGCAVKFGVSFWLGLAAVTALHLCWLVPTDHRHPLLPPACWALSLWFCRLGFLSYRHSAPATVWALCLEGVCLLLAPPLVRRTRRSPTAAGLAERLEQLLATSASALSAHTETGASHLSQEEERLHAAAIAAVRRLCRTEPGIAEDERDRLMKTWVASLAARVPGARKEAFQ